MAGRNRLQKRKTQYVNFYGYFNNKSKNYQKLKDGMRGLNEKITEYSELPAEEFDEEKKRELVNSYAAVMRALEEMLKKLVKSFQPDMEEIGLFVAVRSIMSKDYKTLNSSLQSGKNASLNDILEESRSKTVKLDEDLEKTEHSSGNQNTRYKIKIKKDEENEITGYFTKDKTSVTDSNEQEYVFESLNAIADKYDLNYQSLERGGFYDAACRLVKNPGIFALVSTASSLNECLAEGCNSTLKKFAKACTVNGKTDKETLSIIKNIKDPVHFRALLEFMNALAKPMFENSNKTALGINSGAFTNRRNAAVSSVADALGVSEIVAHSENLKIQIDDNNEDEELRLPPKFIKGTFMEEVKGEDVLKADENSELYKADFSCLEGSKGLVKNIANIQILDYLVGNPDRHSANVIYNIKDGKLLSIVGIDNDTCFGFNDHTKYMAAVTPEKMMVIPKDTADRLMTMDEESFKFMLYGYQITSLEAENAVKRLRVLKEKIMEGEKVYENSVEGNLVPGKLKVCDDEELDKLSIHSQLASKGTDKDGNEFIDTKNLFGVITRRFLEGKGSSDVIANYKEAAFKDIAELCTTDASKINSDLGGFEPDSIKTLLYREMYKSAAEASRLLNGNITYLDAFKDKEDNKLYRIEFSEKMKRLKIAVQTAIERIDTVSEKYAEVINKEKNKYFKANLSELKNDFMSAKEKIDRIGENIEKWNSVVRESKELYEKNKETNDRLKKEAEVKIKKIRLNQLRNDVNTYLEPIEENLAFTRYELSDLSKQIEKENNPEKKNKLMGDLRKKNTENNLNRLSSDAAYGIVSIITDPEGYKNSDSFRRGLAAGLIRYNYSLVNKDRKPQVNKGLKGIPTDLTDYDKCMEDMLKSADFQKTAEKLTPADFTEGDLKNLADGKLPDCLKKIADEYKAELENPLKQNIMGK